MHRYQFTIIGSGVVGTWIAFELSKYTTSICMLEKENDTCMGTSKANSAIISNIAGSGIDMVACCDAMI